MIYKYREAPSIAKTRMGWGRGRGGGGGGGILRLSKVAKTPAAMMYLAIGNSDVMNIRNVWRSLSSSSSSFFILKIIKSTGRWHTRNTHNTQNR